LFTLREGGKEGGREDEEVGKGDEILERVV